MSIASKISSLKDELAGRATLVAVSKTHPASAIAEAYAAGQRIFAESRPQELAAKHAGLPGDIEWHFIGGLQTNKVKYIAPFVAMIQSVDSERLINIINKEAVKNSRIIDVLLEVHIAREETKQGWSPAELREFLSSGRPGALQGIRLRGLMGMATFTDDQEQIAREFTSLRALFDEFARSHRLDTLSMGMSGDWRTALSCGSTMVRIGSQIFGTR